MSHLQALIEIDAAAEAVCSSDPTNSTTDRSLFCSGFLPRENQALNTLEQSPATTLTSCHLPLLLWRSCEGGWSGSSPVTSLEAPRKLLSR